MGIFYYPTELSSQHTSSLQPYASGTSKGLIYGPTNDKAGNVGYSVKTVRPTSFVLFSEMKKRLKLLSRLCPIGNACSEAAIKRIGRNKSISPNYSKETLQIN